ncbi:Nucleotide-binding universal stress protein, UspA family [Pseudonocardia thermophila]|mgnify:CR=1 FL=1|jgi:Universal stress protein UspA and related nucleotide-binding proteins|uniref:Nucleotide-binding universal stress protein, UspA family n=1 Tax=Pseudonocardia thermophila TaxID=1848 RepID=A0A1M6V1A3_PSETH|nr:universal stress protein [Pseudonocardia thermophila]SHK75218.1 Nucleotide-binding universal stress protein, UspA family [Pseudonocardia thermophila]
MERESQGAGEPDAAGALGVVVGVDGSAASSRAVQWAAAEAQLRGLPLQILHAAPYAVDGAGPGRDRAREVLEDAAKLARRRAPGTWITTRCALQPPVPALGAAAARAELLVLGGTERSNSEPTESVGLRVIETAECPVVIVHGRTRTADDDRPIVAGIDSLDPSTPLVADVLAAAAAAARRHKCLLVVLHAGTTTDVDAEAVMGWFDVVHPNLEVRWQMTAGHPTTALLDAARSARLLVIGARGRSAPVRVRMGTTCREVLRRATAPVEVVPGPLPDHRFAETVPEFSPTAADPHDRAQLW